MKEMFPGSCLMMSCGLSDTRYESLGTIDAESAPERLAPVPSAHNAHISYTVSHMYNARPYTSCTWSVATSFRKGYTLR